MDIKVIKDIKTELIIELPGESHSVCNILRKYLMEDEKVKYAVYAIDHPLISNPEISIKTDNKGTPKKSLLAATDKLKENSMELKKLIESIDN
jgi:DNA-directed RNA polymerase subunit L